MPRLPIIGQDTDNWGEILNEFLSVSHRPDGTLWGKISIINVLDFGLSADQSDAILASNTTAFQAAVDAAEGGVLYVPAGIYRVGELFLPSNIVVIGNGHHAILKFTAIRAVDDPKRGCLFTNKNWSEGNENIHIRGLHLFGNRDDSNNLNANAVNKNRGHGISFRFARHCVLEALTIEDFVFDGIYLGSSDPDVGENTGGSSDNVVRFSNIIGNGRNGISVIRGTDNQLLYNLLRNNNKGVSDRDDPSPYRAGAIDIEPNSDFEDVSRTLVHGNRLIDNHFNGIQILTESPSKGIVVSGNVVHGSGVHGIAAARTQHLTITANIVSSSGGTGMALGLGTGVISTIVTSNQVYENHDHGILINGDLSARGIVANNISFQNGNQEEEHQGIVIAAGQDMIVVGNISLSNTGVEQISLPPNNGVFSSNIGRQAGIASFLPSFARTGEGLATTTATVDIVFRRNNNQVWLLHESEKGLFLRNLTTNEPESRIMLESDLEPLLVRLQHLETALSKNS